MTNRKVRCCFFARDYKATIRAVRETKFTPAMRKGQAVPYWIKIDVGFELK